MSKRFAKAVLSRSLPGVYRRIAAHRARTLSHRLEIEWGCAALSRKYVAQKGSEVVGGPFTGLRFPPRTFNRHLLPKLVGAYEMELHGCMAEVLRGGYRTVINVGCAEGYYAVGLARGLTAAAVHAFDIDGWARRRTREMAALNRVRNVEVRGACDHNWLAGNVGSDTFLLSDCEGFEDILLDPERVPALSHADMLVELHEDQAEGVTERLTRRFERTHDIELIGMLERDPASYPTLGGLSQYEKELAVTDLRSDGQQWMMLRSRSGERAMTS